MDVTMVGLQNAGKSSLLRVLAVSTLTLSLFFVPEDWMDGMDQC